jgi:hypothetical protein
MGIHKHLKLFKIAHRIDSKTQEDHEK